MRTVCRYEPEIVLFLGSVSPASLYRCVFSEARNRYANLTCFRLFNAYFCVSSPGLDTQCLKPRRTNAKSHNVALHILSKIAIIFAHKIPIDCLTRNRFGHSQFIIHTNHHYEVLIHRRYPPINRWHIYHRRYRYQQQEEVTSTSSCTSTEG